MHEYLVPDEEEVVVWQNPSFAGKKNALEGADIQIPDRVPVRRNAARLSAMLVAEIHVHLLCDL